MSRDITKLMELKSNIDNTRKAIDTLTEELHRQESELQKCCDHPTISTTRKYYDGGYDYVSCVVITQRCTICEKVLKSYDDPNHKGYHA